MSDASASTERFVASVLELARHELELTVRTRRVLALVALYLFWALSAGITYVLLVRAVEKEALAALGASGVGAAEAARALSLGRERGYAQLVAFFAGADLGTLAPAIRDSIVLPALLWGSLAFLPFLVLLTSYDLLSADVASRAIVFPVLRAPRLAVLLGKLAAHTLLVSLLTGLMALAFVGLGVALLETFSVVDALPGLTRVVLLLVPYAFCYLGLCAFASSVVREPRSGLLLALFVMVALRLLRAITDGDAGPMGWLAWLSPARYQAGLWQDGFAAPLVSSLAYLLFGALLAALAARNLAERDL